VFLGVALMAFAVVWVDASPTLAIAVGAAAGMAAQTKLLISPVLFGALLVGSQGRTRFRPPSSRQRPRGSR
jgi:chloride channel protein, CIC family